MCRDILEMRIHEPFGSPDVTKIDHSAGPSLARFTGLARSGRSFMAGRRRYLRDSLVELAPPALAELRASEGALNSVGGEKGRGVRFPPLPRAVGWRSRGEGRQSHGLSRGMPKLSTILCYKLGVAPLCSRCMVRRQGEGHKAPKGAFRLFQPRLQAQAPGVGCYDRATTGSSWTTGAGLRVSRAAHFSSQRSPTFTMPGR